MTQIDRENISVQRVHSALLPIPGTIRTTSPTLFSDLPSESNFYSG